MSSARAPYFIGPLVDATLIGGFSVAVFAAMKIGGTSGYQTEALHAAALLMWVVNWPHFSATNYRLYHSAENRAQYPMTAYVVPVAMVASVVLALASPTDFGAYFIKVYIIWSPYHFSAQTMGIAIVYGVRSGFFMTPLERRCLSMFVFCTFLYPTALFEVGTTDAWYFGIQYPPFGIPAWVPGALLVVMVTSGCAFMALLAMSKDRKGRRWPPWIFFIPAVTQYVWFVAGRDLVGYREFVPAFHSVQYLLIAWAVQLKERVDAQDSLGEGRPRWFLRRETARWYAMNILGGIALFWVLPRIAALGGTSLLIAEGILAAAAQVHHFFVDGVIWKLRYKTVSSPLMASLSQMARP